VSEKFYAEGDHCFECGRRLLSRNVLSVYREATRLSMGFCSWSCFDSYRARGGFEEDDDLLAELDFKEVNTCKHPDWKFESLTTVRCTTCGLVREFSMGKGLRDE